MVCGRKNFWDRFSVRTEILSLATKIQASCKAHRASYNMGTDKSGRSLKLTSHIRLHLRLRMHGVMHHFLRRPTIVVVN